MKTIKQLADELGVSKTAIRNYMTADFRAKYTAKDRKGVITITEEGCKLLSENFGNQEKPAQTNENHFPETELLTIPKSVWELMESQIREKDEQLRIKDEQIVNLTTALKEQAQSINADRHNTLAGTIRPMLEDKENKPGILARLKSIFE